MRRLLDWIVPARAVRVIGFTERSTPSYYAQRLRRELMLRRDLFSHLAPSEANDGCIAGQP